MGTKVYSLNIQTRNLYPQGPLIVSVPYGNLMVEHVQLGSGERQLCKRDLLLRGRSVGRGVGSVWES